MKTEIILIFIFLLLSNVVIAEQILISDKIEEGDTQTYNYLGNNYQIEMTFCSPNQGNKVRINGVLSPILYKDDLWEFNSNLKLKMGIERYEEPMVTTCSFEIISFGCGDEVCDAEEENNCPTDCELCGNGKCDINENCEEDNCCNGESINFQNDKNNCGNCGNKCSTYEKCENSECIKYCGNGICDNDETCRTCTEECSCESDEECINDICTSEYCGDGKCNNNENCGSCLIDCKCNENYNCTNSLCISINKCSNSIECNDNNSSTIDSCEGNPKKCIYIEKLPEINQTKDLSEKTYEKESNSIISKGNNLSINITTFNTPNEKNNEEPLWETITNYFLNLFKNLFN